MNQSIARFNQDHPNIEIVNSVQPWDNREQRAATAMASSNPPGVIMTRREETYKFAQEGLIIPITDYVQASGLDIDKLFYKTDIDNQRWQGQLWSLPLPGDGGSTSIYLYNKELLQKSGFDPEKPPQTWQEMENVAKATTVINNGIKTLGANVGTGYDFPVWLYCNGGKYCTDDAKQLTFNSPEGIAALEWMASFTKNINGGIENVSDFLNGTSDTSADFPFYDNRYAIWFTGTWAFGHMASWDPNLWKDPTKWGVALRPYNGNNAQATHHGTSGLQWAWGYTIPKTSPKKAQDAAYQWVEWWITQSNPKEVGGCQFLFAQSQVSAVVKCTEDPAWGDGNPYWDVIIKSMGTDVSVPISPVQTQITAILNDAVESAVYGKQSAKEALDSAAQKSQAVLDKFWSGA